ncbi:MAG: DegQ family serine endoprotease [bacterium]
MKKRAWIIIAALMFFSLAAAGEARATAISEAELESGAVVPASWYRAETLSFADLAERVQAAVVNISTSKSVRGRSSMMPRFGPQDPFDDFFQRFFDQDMVPQEQMQHSLGSGFIIDKNGTILTNNHVVSQADEIEVALSNGRKYKAKILGRDEKTDIAIIKIEADNDLPVVMLGNSKILRPGDWVMAIGNPFGLEQTVTVGVVSAKGRVIGGGPYAHFIQTDASINPGNSGGPLFNVKGEVVGINTMIYAAGQGIGFAIPIDLVSSMLTEMISTGGVTHGWLGVAIQTITPDLAKSFNLKGEDGALITEVMSDSPAAKAGLKRGDVILSFDDNKIDDPMDLSVAVGQAKPGKESKLKVLRNGEEQEFAIAIGSQSETKAARAEPDSAPWSPGKADQLGLVVKQITPELAAQLDVPENFRGVMVARVEPGSSVERGDVRTGDVILEVNGDKIQSMDDYNKALEKLKKGDMVRLFIKRGRASIYLAFTL